MLLTTLNLFESLSGFLCIIIGFYRLRSGVLSPVLVALWFTMGVQSAAGAFEVFYGQPLLDYRYLLSFLYGPFIFLAIKELLFDGFSWNWSKSLHLIPIVLVAYLLYRGLMSWEMVGFPVAIIGSIYLACSFYQLRLYSRTIALTRSPEDGGPHVWLHRILMLMVAMAVVQSCRSAVGVETPAGYMVGLLFHAGLSLGLGVYIVFGLAIPIPLSPLGRAEISLREDIESDQSMTVDGDIGQLPLSSLEQYIEKEAPHLNPDMNLQTMAEELDYSPRKLSALIKREWDCTFPQWINLLRVKTAERMMRNPCYHDMSIVDIGLQSGFNSKSSFNLMFKRIKHTTPAKYRRRLLEKTDR